jgi:hypothetical protein
MARPTSEEDPFGQRPVFIGFRFPSFTNLRAGMLRRSRVTVGEVVIRAGHQKIIPNEPDAQTRRSIKPPSIAPQMGTQ